MLTDVGAGRGDTVSVILANTPAMLEVHYAVPMQVPYCTVSILDSTRREDDSFPATVLVAIPHPKWGETLCAFVEIEAGAKLTKNDLARWCKQHLARYKMPKHFELQLIIKRPTSKVQKFSLRAHAIKIPGSLFDGL